jgi:hypothetical protein
MPEAGLTRAFLSTAPGLPAIGPAHARSPQIEVALGETGSDPGAAGEAGAGRGYLGVPPMALPSRLLVLVCSGASFAASTGLASAGIALASAGGQAPASGATVRSIAFSEASGLVVQRQPSPGTCHARGSGLYAMPDPRCTPGALNRAVTPATLDSTICRAGWTSTVRPPASITAREKPLSMAAYGDGAQLSRYEYDHLVPLELGGAVNDPRNLWPEPDYRSHAGFYANPKDLLERALNRRVCARTMSLGAAQRLVAGDWVAAFRAYG